MLLLNIEGPKPPEVVPLAAMRDVPADLIERCQAISTAQGNLTRLRNGSEGVDATIVPYEPDAADRLRDFKAMIERLEVKANVRQAPFLNRAAEHAIKLALTVAVGCSSERPTITRNYGLGLPPCLAFNLLDD